MQSVFERLLMHLNDNHKGIPLKLNLCSSCGKRFSTKTQLHSHIKSKCGTEKPYRCEECDKTLMSPGSLHNHKKQHNGNASFMCRYCAKMFLFSGQLEIHEKRHTKQKDFVCETCGKGFSHRQSLITHNSVHTGIKPYQCESCSKSFSCIGNLLKHRHIRNDSCGTVPLTSHSVKNPSTKIKLCINTPSSTRIKRNLVNDNLEEKLRTLEKHTTEDNFDKITSLPASSDNLVANINETGDTVQDTTYLSKSLQLNNINRKEKKAVNGLQCTFCGKKYTNLKWLSKHQKYHSVTNETSELTNKNTKGKIEKHQLESHGNVLSCSECGDKIFSTSDALKAHRNNFHKGTPRKQYYYVCQKCGKCLRQKFQMKQHELSNCDSIQSYQCKLCQKSFSTPHTLKSHLKVHLEEKDNTCKFCNKKFRWKGQLKVHERAHTGEKPFSCLFCPSSFAYRASLVTHSSIHTGNKPFVCQCCGWRFSCAGNLAKHRVSHATTCGEWLNANNSVDESI